MMKGSNCMQTCPTDLRISFTFPCNKGTIVPVSPGRWRLYTQYNILAVGMQETFSELQKHALHIRGSIVKSNPSLL